MPPQVNPYGPGTKSIANETCNQAEEAKSKELEKKSTESKPQESKKEPQDPKANARAARGSIQNATDRTGQHRVQAQMIKTDLHKQLPKNESGSMYDTLKTASDLVAVKLPAAAKATAEAAAEAGAIGIRKQGIKQLSQRAHPQDMVKGQMFEVEEIRHAFSDTDKVETLKNSEYLTEAAKGNFFKATDHPQQSREATQAGLKKRLTELNNGAPLTEFENNLVTRFNDIRPVGSKDPSIETSIRAGGHINKLTPIKGSGKEVEAYKVQEGVLETYYDRHGNVLRGRQAMPEKALEEGIAPWEVISLAQAGKHLLTKGAMVFGEEILAKEAATSFTKAESGAVLRSVDQELVQAEPTIARTAEQQAANSAEAHAVDSKAATSPEVPAAPQQPIAEPAPVNQPGPAPVMNPPGELNRQIYVRTPQGTETITVGEYRSRVNQARQWVETQRAESGEMIQKGQTFQNRPTPSQRARAAEMFGLDEDWDRLGNTNMGRGVI